tara:strand:+ start:358 stop:621 length:264 start_codon:yes stop_codon:yes gene_type:complete
MKTFFYKSILVFTLFILSIHFSFSIIIKDLKYNFLTFASKEGLEVFKIKIREELKNGSKKNNLINPEDAKLINEILKKIKFDLEKNK